MGRYFGVVGVFCITNGDFQCFVTFSVVFCVYESILKYIRGLCFECFFFEKQRQSSVCYFKFRSRADMLFSNRGEKLVCAISRKSEMDEKHDFQFLGTEPPFRANLRVCSKWF